MTELALDHDQRDAFACHLDGVGVSDLVRLAAHLPNAAVPSGHRDAQRGLTPRIEAAQK